ncbi:MAG: hypothetical protein GY938_05035 [Ketobacter sp.]|nr:hypothetical protein [Ketobacter sp.]
MANIPLKITAGMVVTESIFSEPGRWVDGDKVRFYRHKPQKIGGWEKFGSNQYTGVARALHAWSDNNYNALVMVGTHCKLMVYDTNKIITDVTPIEMSGSFATDPITTVSGSDQVTITHTTHGRISGSTVIIAGAAAVGGLTIDGSYVVGAITDADNYVITASSNASSSATGGGASVTYQYELNCGFIDATTGGGWGIGGWGQEEWGDERENATYIQPARIWSLPSYGEDVLACPTDGSIYLYDTSVGGRATIVSNAPTSNKAIFVSEDRHLIALGADGTAMLVRWPDQDDITDWTPGSSSTAGSRTLQEGSRLVAGTVLQNLINMIWSDSAAYIWQYTGTSSTFSSRLIGKECGLIGPKAFVVVGGVSFWMSKSQFHYYSGSVQEIPNADDVREFVIDNLSAIQGVKTFAGYIQEFKEIWWWYVVEGDTEPSLYVAYNMTDHSWTKGSMARAAFTNQESLAKEPLLSGTNNTTDYIYTHEIGLNDDSGAAINSYITMAPFNIQEGSVNVDVFGYEPDFKRQVGDITLTLNTYSHSREAALLDTEVKTITPAVTDVDPRVSGRYLGLTIQSNAIGGDFRLGEPRMEIQEAGERQA